MKFDLDIFCKTVIPFLTLLAGAWLNRFLEKRVKLIAYFVHASATEIKTSATPIVVHGHSIVVLNSGKITANNVRITHHTLPDFSIYPPVNYSIEDLQGGSKEIVISKLIPGQQVTISYLYFPPIIYSHIHNGIKSDEVFAKVITVIPSPQYPNWVLNLIRVLMLIGTASVLYLIYALVKYFVE